MSTAQKLIVFVASQLSLMAVLAPWATLKETTAVNDRCTLPVNYQFRQWGGACDMSWEELKELHQNSYFAMLHSLTKIRVMSMFCVVLLNLCIICNQRYRNIAILINIIVFTLGVMSTTMYFTEQNTTMVLHVQTLILQGLGFWAQVFTSSLCASVVFTYFFERYHQQ